jgi:hypothetical protein
VCCRPQPLCPMSVCNPRKALPAALYALWQLGDVLELADVKNQASRASALHCFPVHFGGGAGEIEDMNGASTGAPICCSCSAWGNWNTSAVTWGFFSCFPASRVAVAQPSPGFKSLQCQRKVSASRPLSIHDECAMFSKQQQQQDAREQAGGSSKMDTAAQVRSWQVFPAPTPFSRGPGVGAAARPVPGPPHHAPPAGLHQVFLPKQQHIVSGVWGRETDVVCCVCMQAIVLSHMYVAGEYRAQRLANSTFLVHRLTPTPTFMPLQALTATR